MSEITVRLEFDSGKVVYVDGEEVDDLERVLDEYGLVDSIGFNGDDGFDVETTETYLQPGIVVPSWGEVVYSETISV